MNTYRCILLITDHTPTLDIRKPEDRYYFEFRNSWKKYMNRHNDILSLFISIDENLKYGEYNLDLENNTLYVHGKESLQLGILEKTLYSMKYLSELYNYDFIIRTNLSTFFNIDIFRDIILSLPLDNTFAGCVVFNYFINGGCQIISKNLILKVIPEINNIIQSYNGSEDVTISNFIRKYVDIRNITDMFYFITALGVSYNNFTSVEELDNIIKKSDDKETFYYRIKDVNNSEYRKDDVLVHERLCKYFYNI